jgi:hypothetical protein
MADIVKQQTEIVAELPTAVEQATPTTDPVELIAEVKQIVTKLLDDAIGNMFGQCGHWADNVDRGLLSEPLKQLVKTSITDPSISSADVQLLVDALGGELIECIDEGIQNAMYRSLRGENVRLDVRSQSGYVIAGVLKDAELNLAEGKAVDHCRCGEQCHPPDTPVPLV